MSRPLTHLMLAPARRAVVPPLWTPAVVFAFAGCSTAIAPENPLTNAISSFETEGIVFTASAERTAERTLSVTIRAVNQRQTPSSASILGGNCMIRVRLYHASQGLLIWSAFESQQVCQEPLRTIQLGPGGEELLTATTEVDVGAGSYFVTATIEYPAGFPSPFVEIIAGNVEFP